MRKYGIHYNLSIPLVNYLVERYPQTANNSGIFLLISCTENIQYNFSVSSFIGMDKKVQSSFTTLILQRSRNRVILFVSYRVKMCLWSNGHLEIISDLISSRMLHTSESTCHWYFSPNHIEKNQDLILQPKLSNLETSERPIFLALSYISKC